jgi:hypothetical protein
MPNTALNRTTTALLTNKSGGTLTYGAVVVVDTANDNAFTTTVAEGNSTKQVGVILEPSGIANNASGMVAVGGWIPKITLNTAATVGQFLKTHTVAGQATPHASPQVEGDFGVALEASATPSAILFGSPNAPLGGGAVTTGVTLTAGQFVVGAGGSAVAILAPGGNYLCYQDQKAQNTAGGTFTSGSWQTRVLNTEVSDVGGYGTLAGNQITLTAGSYRIYATAPGLTCDRHQARLQNVTAGTTILTGTSELATSAAGVTSRSVVVGFFTVAAAQALELQHQCQTTAATLGFGPACNFTTEIFSVVELWKEG